MTPMLIASETGEELRPTLGWEDFLDDEFDYDDMYCPNDPLGDNLHCDHWQDGGTCCYCQSE